MESPDVESLISMVQDLTKELDNYVSGSSKRSEAVSHILNVCEQIRTKEIDGTVHYWLGVIEQHAKRIGSSGTRRGTVGYFPASEAYSGIRLRVGIHSLRTQVMNGTR
jgi:hypothetical protein